MEKNESRLFDNQTENETTTEAAIILPTKRPLLTVQQLAAHLSVSQSWVYKQVGARKIPHIKFGTALRFDTDEVIAFFQKKEI